MKTHTRKRSAAKLLRIVGMERFLTLREEFGGKSVWIPKRGEIWPGGLSGVRNRCIEKWHRQGLSAEAIAAALKMKPETVARILRTARRSRRHPSPH